MSETETAAVAEKTIHVGIIEDRRELREGLCMLINGTDGFCCKAKFGSMEEGLRRLGAIDFAAIQRAGNQSVFDFFDRVYGRSQKEHMLQLFPTWHSPNQPT